jgi:hypothetical protein
VLCSSSSSSSSGGGGGGLGWIGLCKVKCSVRAFQDPETRKFLEPEEKVFKYLQEQPNNGNISYRMLVMSA